MRRVLALVVASVGLFAFPGAAFALPAGSLDTSFGTNGFVRSDVFPSVDEVGSAAVDDQGRTLVVGTFGPGCPCTGDVFLARYKPDGTLDPTFDGDGVKTLTGGGFHSARSVAIQSTGRILVAYQDQSGPGASVVLGLTPTGATDATFGTGGTATVPDIDSLGTMALAGDKILLAGGQTVGVGVSDFAIVRLTANGGTDSTFNTDGSVVAIDTTGAGDDDIADAVAAAPDGKIVAVGTEEDVSYDNLAIVRLDSAGAADTTFDGDGLQIVDFGDEFEFPASVAVMPDGRIVAAGGVDNVAGPSPSIDAAVARLKINGDPDPDFSVDGQQTTSDSFQAADVSSVLVQPDGKVLVGGSLTPLAPSTVPGFVYRYTATGDLDPSFSGDGKTYISGGQSTVFEVDSLAFAADGRVTAVGLFLDVNAAGPPDDDSETALARVLTAADNCPDVSNPDQADLDGDGLGDACDDDIDGDGLSNAVETAIGSDPRSLDSDGDGRVDSIDACPATAGTLANGCPAPVVQVPPGNGGTGGNGDGGNGKIDQPVIDRTAPKVTLTGAASKLTRKLFFKSGLSFKVHLDEPCTALVELIGSLRGGVHIARAGDVILASKVLKLGSGQKVTLKLGALQKKLIGKTAKLTLRITAFDRTGNPKVATRTIRVK